VQRCLSSWSSRSSAFPFGRGSALALVFAGAAFVGQTHPAAAAPAGIAAVAGGAAAETPAPPSGPSAPALPIIAPPVAGGLTADEVAQRAAVSSREVAARGEENLAAQAGVDQANAGYIPRLSGLARYTRLSSIEQPSLGTLVAAPPGTPNPIPAGTPLVAVPLSFPVILDQYTTAASLQVPLSDYLLRLPQLRESASKNARAAALMQQATRLRVATEARTVYYGWARARLQADVAQRAVVQAQAHLKDAETAHSTGVSSKADVLRVASQVASAELLLARANAAVAVSERRLRTVMHDESGRRFEIGEDLRGVPAGPEPGLLAEAPKRLIEQAIARRYEPRALQETAGGIQAQASAIRAAALPRLDAVANASYAQPNGRYFPQREEFRGTWDASLQLTWAPTDLFGAEAGRSAVLARARQVEQERGVLIDGITMEVVQGLEALRESESAMTTSARGLDAAEESYRVRRALYQNGRATSVELTDAETERSRAQLEAIGAQIDRRIAVARLRHALGNDTVETDRP
jgi:outer membrane protein